MNLEIQLVGARSYVINVYTKNNGIIISKQKIGN